MSEQTELETIREEPRIFAFVGAYGSGKSEVSVNFARKMRHEQPDRTIVLADLDIVNPFYRSLDAKSLLEAENIQVIGPNFANSNVDVPSVPGEIFAVFDQPDTLGVLDIGGEDLGARILASMYSRFSKVEYRIYMVVNTMRPFTAQVQGIVEMAQLLQESARLPIAGLIDNSNLLEQTSPDTLIESYPILQEAADQLGIPFVYACGLDDYLPKRWTDVTGQGIPLLRMSRSIFYSSNE